ncbi:MAG TPA: type I restriction-modification system subunit M [Candidatus Ignatzschineria merdigallinarum]|uniref:site-specific DNA-methyltransferase (adenine-specific) n=1 Tax=Candidatus Ignatzschineria merdigallinarum TaxID=2838621 RepID=A0A9D1Q6S1_9GAMM|nr:type I restriction-modification system subunit M [Candidatus Ignatzschineria merdigallinarum]
MTHDTIVQKLWSLCDVLRDDGVNYSKYVTELALLLFLKMNHEQNSNVLPKGYRWENLTELDGIDLLNFYRKLLLVLGTGKDSVTNEKDGSIEEITIHTNHLVKAIYTDANTSIREPRHLSQLIRDLDKIDWFSVEKDDLGNMYEGLLERNASETKSGAGQYFTPRPLINSMVRLMKPQVGELIQDPAAGTAGFLIAADQYIKNHTDNLYDLDENKRMFQRKKALVGVELVPDTRRLALMNCLLHDIEGEDDGAILLGNTLGSVGANLSRADLILANPPFGTARGGEASITRDDFTHVTSNKQLVFLQHIYRNLKDGGRAAVVVPDNVLFEDGIGADIRRDLMEKCDLHTILRLPTGIFYAQGVKTNVLFFTKGKPTENVWVYDLRTNMPSFGKRTPFTESYLAPFETIYGDDPYGKSKRTEGEWSSWIKTENSDTEDTIENSRWRVFTRDYIRDEKKDSLDISWLRDHDAIQSENLPDPEILALEAMSELTDVFGALDQLLNDLGAGDEANAQKTLLVDLVNEAK